MKNNGVNKVTISIEEVQQFKLKWKPKCPCCQKPLAFVYAGITKGSLNQKCGNCGRCSIVDIETMTVMEIREDKAG